MATETLGIAITSTGAKVVQKEIEGIGDAGEKAQKQVDKSTAGMVKDFDEVGKAATKAGKDGAKGVDNLTASTDKASKSGGALTAVITGLVAAVSVKELVKASDAYTVIQNRLSSVTDSAEETEKVYQQLKKVSLDTGTTIDGNVKIFQSLQSVAKSFNLSGEDVSKTTEGIAKAMKATGASGQAADAALLQLSQSLGSGVLRGQEFNSILEGAPGLLDVVAKELHTTRGGLRAFAEDGKITTQVIKNAFVNNFDAISKASDGVSLTISAAFTNLNTQFNDYIGTMGKATGISSTFASVIGFVANNLNLLVPAILAIGVAFATVQLARLGAEVLDLGNKLRIVILENPILAAISAIILVVGILVEKFVGWGTVLTYLQAGITVFGQVAYNAFVGIYNSVIRVLNGLQELGKYLHLVDAAAPPFVELKKVTVDAAKALEEAKASSVSLNSALGNTATSSGQVASSANNAAGATNNFSNSMAAASSQAQATANAYQRLLEVQQRVAASHPGELAGDLTGGSGTSSLGGFGGTGTSFSGGGFHTFRDGGNMRVPGTGPTDSRLVQFMATPGEVVSISTPAQQAKNPNIPHFRDGGALGITRGLSGIDIKTVLADDQSVTGFNGGTGGALASDLIKTIINSLGIYKVGNPLIWQRRISAEDYLRGDPLARFQVGNQGQVSALRSGQDIIDFYKGSTPQDAYKNGPYDFTTQQKLDAQAAAASDASKIADLKRDIKAHLDDINARQAAFTAIQVANNWKRKQQINLTDDDLKYLALAKKYGVAGGKGFIDGAKQLTGFSFRDGGQFTVPGGGPVDSVHLPMQVSPGERVTVETPAQQARGRRGVGSGGVTNIYVTVQASDADSFKRSQSQTLRDFADKVGAAVTGG